jgi:hypothetical protein
VHARCVRRADRRALVPARARSAFSGTRRCFDVPAGRSRLARAGPDIRSLSALDTVAWPSSGDLLHFFAFPRHLWRKLRTTNVIERCFVEVRRRTRPMVVFTNVESVDRIIYAIFSRFNEDWKNHTLELFTQAA